MSSNEQISEQLFKILKGYGHNVALFTDEGMKTVDPTEARRFYAEDIRMMVNYDTSSDNGKITINLSKGTNIASVTVMLTALRKLANSNVVQFTVKTFGKDITPKDFAYQAKAVKESQMDINEGFSGWHGSARKSINELGDAKIIVRHKRSVDEEKRGARTRQIESIFIENAEGERFKFPTKNLTAAKAMLRHVNEGGAPYDEFGQYIYECMAELNHLKKFQRSNKRSNFFEDESITEEINTRIFRLRETLRQISGVKGYPRHFENFSNNNLELSAEKLDELKDSVTIRYFDETINDSLPYVARIIENLRTKRGMEKTVKQFIKYVIDHEDNFMFKANLDDDDLDSPELQQYNSKQAELHAELSYLAKLTTNDDLSNKLMQIADIVDNVDARMISLVEKALGVIKQRSGVSESEHMPVNESAIYDDELSNINSVFDQFELKEIFKRNV